MSPFDFDDECIKCSKKYYDGKSHYHFLAYIVTGPFCFGQLLYFFYNILGSELQDGDIWDLADTKKDIYSLWDRCPFYYAYLLILDGWN